MDDNDGKYYVYFAKSAKNGKIYVGFTKKNPKIRIKEHNTGKNKWSNDNKPFILIYYEKYFCEKDARLRERYFKSGFGKRVKYAIIKEFYKAQ